MKYKISEYPIELVENRGTIEGNFIFSLYKEPELYDEYKHLSADELNGEIRLDEGRFYFNLGKEMTDLGYKTLDDLTIFSYLENKAESKRKFDELGGYEPIREAKEIIDSENNPVFYDELAKNNLILDLYEKGFNVKQDLNKFKNMKCEEVYDYYDFMLNNITLGSKINRLETHNLSENYGEFIKTWDSGVGSGFKLGFPILNYSVAGLHLGTLSLVSAHIGKGKSSILLPMMILPLIEIGEDITIIANEQIENDWRIMVISSVLSSKIGYFGMNRSKFLFGGFSEEDKKHLKLAEEWLEKQKGKIRYSHLFDYDIKTVKKIVKKYSKLGCRIFIYDTAKPQTEDVNAWSAFSEDAKLLFQVAHQQNVAIVATAQLSGGSQSRRWLGLDCIGKSKSIAETTAMCLLFRPLRPEELDPENSKYIKVWRNARNKDTGKLMDTKEEITLNPNHQHIALFLSKNRYGESDVVIIYERNLSWNTYRELGFASNIPYDGF